MDSPFSRVPATGLQHTPRSSFGGQNYTPGMVTSGSPTQSQNNSSYLPGYLLGGHTPASQMSYTHRDSPHSQSRSKSPGKMKSWSPSRSGSNHSRLSSTREKKDMESMRHTFSNSPTPKSLRGKAPPVADLFSDTGLSNGHSSPYGRTSPLRRDNQSMDVHMVTQPSQTQSPAPRGGHQFQPSSSDLRDYLLSPSRKTFPSPAQVDPFYSQGETITSTESLDECCITIFGFPPAASSFILQQFSQYGNILKHEVASNGNWMHIKFQSKLQAKKALSKNGKIFGSNVMVGVKQCIDKNFMFDSGKENFPSTSSSTSEVPSSSPSSRNTPIRPLTAAYQAASSDLEVAGSGSNTPQKNNNLVSKAMEYVFGW